MSATSSRPARWNAAAATTRIAALTKNAIDSATVESMVAYLIAWCLSASDACHARVCTIDECRYRLCGITVAPRMPMAMYNIAGLVTICADGTRPAAMAANDG